MVGGNGNLPCESRTSQLDADLNGDNLRAGRKGEKRDRSGSIKGSLKKGLSERCR